MEPPTTTEEYSPMKIEETEICTLVALLLAGQYAMDQLLSPRRRQDVLWQASALCSMPLRPARDTSVSYLTQQTIEALLAAIRSSPATTRQETVRRVSFASTGTEK